MFVSEKDQPNMHIWRAKIPLKIKIFIWLIQQNAILTKDNLIRRNWKGNKFCAFCNEEETISHLFFECVVVKYVWSIIALTIGANCRPELAEQYMVWIQKFLPSGKKFHIVGLAAVIWATWKIRNRACFEKKLIKSPTEIVCYASVFLNYWAGLQKKQEKDDLQEGAKILQQNAIAVHPRKPEDGRDEEILAIVPA